MTMIYLTRTSLYIKPPYIAIENTVSNSIHVTLQAQVFISSPIVLWHCERGSKYGRQGCRTRSPAMKTPSIYDS
jgi:hypothetical protein